MLTFFTNPMSRGRIVRWMLEEAGAPYETLLTTWGAPPPALLAANQLGKVPTIVHDGAVMTETAAICAYLAEAFPDAGLAPRAEERASYHRWMFFTAGPGSRFVPVWRTPRRCATRCGRKASAARR